MKKIIPISVCLLSIGVMVGAYFASDRKAPSINVSDVPEISCSLKYEELLNYASSDDEDLKSFFVEEGSLSEIANNGYLTYVAIDTNNNVSKLKVNVSIASELINYHIELLQPLKAQIHETFKTGEYLTLKNDCGWNINDTFNIEGVDYDLKGEYDVKVTAKSHSEVEALVTTMKVDDFESPVINLASESIDVHSGLLFSDEWFLKNIVSVEDDNDDGEELLSRVSTNWKDVMLPSSSGYVSKEGTYTITYRVTDSDGNTGTATLHLSLKKQSMVVEQTTEGENNE